jgi:hypothetical protein
MVVIIDQTDEILDLKIVTYLIKQRRLLSEEEEPSVEAYPNPTALVMELQMAVAVGLALALALEEHEMTEVVHHRMTEVVELVLLL